MSSDAPITPLHPFAAEPVQRLLAEELRALAPELAGVFGRQGLVVQAGSPGDAAPAPSAPMLGRIFRLQVAGPDRLSGDVDCDPAQLPFVDASFRLVLVQHAAEAIARPDAFRNEIARIVEPGGILMVLGFQPLGLWRPWLLWQQWRRGAAAVRVQPAWLWREALAEAGIDAYAMRRIGSLTPQTAATDHAVPPLVRKALTPLRPSWLLLARKRSLGPTLIARKALLRTPVVSPQLASGTQRNSA